MARYVFDIETNELALDKIKTIHVLCVANVDTGEAFTFRGGDVSRGIYELNDADEVIGHNVVRFDVPVIQKLYPNFKPKKVIDTLVLSRLLYPDVSLLKTDGLPSNLTTSHSLEAWGYRLGNYKGDFHGPWDVCTDEMVEYCEQDVQVTKQLYMKLLYLGPTPESVKLEHEFATIIAMMERRGFAFNEAKAIDLLSELVAERLKLSDEMAETFPPVVHTETIVPKVSNKAKGWVKGVPYLKSTTTHFNPNSRQQIAARLQGLGWKPTEFTPSGQPKVDEDTLEKLPYPEAKKLAHYFMICKRIGQLSEGDQAWLKKVEKGRIHGSVNTNGAVTGRCTHSNPNMSQVPSVKKPFGKQCRALFEASPGMVMVGIDLSGLELRCLAHFMAKHDGGAYGKVLLEGDIHTSNQQAAGLPTRDNAKTFIYAFLYGAGDVKIGSIVHPHAKLSAQRKVGKVLKERFLASLPSLKKLKAEVELKVKVTSSLRGLDGRTLHIRSPHSALNTLLQSAGALIAKQATIFAYSNLCKAGYKWGKDWALVAHIHDEMQIEARPEIAEEVGRIVVQSMQQAGEHFKFRVPITGEWKVGQNWAETH